MADASTTPRVPPDDAMNDAWLDVSVPFAPGIPPWPGDTPCSCGWAWAMADGASVNVSRLETSPHVGTHADAPLHVRADGAAANTLPLAPFRGEAVVTDVSAIDGAIDLARLAAAGVRPGVERLVLRTGRTTATGDFPSGWPALAPEAARALVVAGLRLLAVDCPSVDARESTSLEVHHTLFDGGAFVLENLDLRAVPTGRCELLALPMPVGAYDAAPVRALLRPLATYRAAADAAERSSGTKRSR